MQEQGRGPHRGRQKVLEEEEEKEVGMQVGLVELQVRASLGVWEEEWGTRRRRGGEQGGRAGGGARKQEAGERQGEDHVSVSAQ